MKTYSEEMQTSINQLGIGFLDFVICQCGYDRLLISDGKIVGQEETPAAATVRESR